MEYVCLLVQPFFECNKIQLIISFSIYRLSYLIYQFGYFWKNIVDFIQHVSDKIVDSSEGIVVTVYSTRVAVYTVSRMQRTDLQRAGLAPARARARAVRTAPPRLWAGWPRAAPPSRLDGQQSVARCARLGSITSPAVLSIAHITPPYKKLRLAVASSSSLYTTTAVNQILSF